MTARFRAGCIPAILSSTAAIGYAFGRRGISQHDRSIFRTSKIGKRLCTAVWAALLCTPTMAVLAEPLLHPTGTQGGNVGTPDAGQVISYPVTFFGQYHPRTALDLVQRLPGYRIDDGDGLRGFGAAAGNLLINGRRPSSKQDRPSEILDRLPADYVERIDLIRGAVRGIDSRGHSLLANVILRRDLPAAVQWEALVRKDFRAGPLSPGASVSRADNWRDVQYSIGLTANRRAGLVQGGRESLLDGDDELLEGRIESFIDMTWDTAASANVAKWFGNTFVQLNTILFVDSSEATETSMRVPVPGSEEPQRTEIFSDGFDRLQFELGADAERFLNSNLVATAIALFFFEDREGFSSQRQHAIDDVLLLARDADSESKAIEGITRLQFAWAGIPNHLIQLNLEGAWNSLDNDLVLFVDSGSGPTTVAIPGANAKVEEMRGDVLLNDTWSLGAIELDFGIGLEMSTISQRGDIELSRSFFYFKPRAMVTYAPEEDRQTRFRLARDVAQLDFNEFVSATNFADDDLALGNPELRPETTWIVELIHERRFGNRGVARFIGYYHWISEVEDLLPLTEKFEAPGNIGNGKRWGVDLQGTLPLGVLGLENSRFDIRAKWQDSRVTDPVTKRPRVLSDEQEYELALAYRQDFSQAAAAWGWDINVAAERPLFKVNELDTFENRLAVNAFAEITGWRGIRLRLFAEHLFNTRLLRDRTIHSGERGLSPVEFRELRERRRGMRLTVSVSGAF